MAAPEARAELSALEETRARLEAALADDENWRALQQTVEADDSAEAGAARRVRDTRLEMALGGNPIYQAWRHVSDAIGALREGTADLEAAAAATHIPLADGDDWVREAFELPQEIAGLIRDAAPGAEAGPSGDLGTLLPVPDTADADAHREDEPSETQSRDEDAAKPAAPPRSFAARLAQAADSVPQAEVPQPDRPQADARTAGAEAERRHDPEPDIRIAVGAEEEASVTFVRRRTRQPLLPSAQLPADLGSERKSSLFDRLRAVKDDAEPEDAFALRATEAEEAEVVIVTSESLREKAAAEVRAGQVRRFRKALSGD
jgi:hypothetical protein